MSDPERDELVARASAAAEHSVAPHSGFRVGAAGATADGSVFTGVNVESDSYPVGFCAETALVAVAASAGVRPGGLVAVAVVADGELVAPCGRCRQLLHEFGGPDLVVNGKPMSWWLPEAFGGPDRSRP